MSGSGLRLFDLGSNTIKTNDSVTTLSSVTSMSGVDTISGLDTINNNIKITSGGSIRIQDTTGNHESIFFINLPGDTPTAGTSPFTSKSVYQICLLEDQNSGSEGASLSYGARVAGGHYNWNSGFDGGSYRWYVKNIQRMRLDGSGSLTITGTFNPGSDDRLKENEVLITEAITTLQKLKPQNYDKKPTFNSTDTTSWQRESGLIAQQVYYDAPELRQLVYIPPGVSPAANIDTGDDPSVDPDYSSWGDEPAGFNYDGLTAYLVKAIQEQQTIIEGLSARITVLENA